MAGRSPAHISGFSAWTLRVGVLAAIVVGAYLTFELGRMQAGYSLVDARRDKAALREEISALEAEVVALKEDVALQQTHRSIDRAAYEEVETSLAELQQKIQEQRDAIEFYRGIMAPDEAGRGLRVQDVRLSPGASDNEFQLRLVLVQVNRHDRAVKGDVGFTLDGAKDGQPASYSLDELLPADADSSWPFSFRYFQAFDRKLILPDGFVPERVHVEVRSRTKSIASIEQTFAWRSSKG